jgi:hypothetical protein
MKQFWAILIGGLAVLVCAILYVAMPGHAPAGQPPLIEIDSRATVLRQEFNRSSDRVRVILLLSPT